MKNPLPEGSCANLEDADTEEDAYREAAIAIDVEEPMFESQTKTKLGSNNMWPAAPSLFMEKGL